MIFALATDDRGLTVFPNLESAIAYCEGIDIEDGLWLFWDGNGEALEAVFSRPNERNRFSVLSGTYSLRPSPNGKGFLESIEHVGYLEENPHFASLDAVVAHVARRGVAKHDCA